MERTHTLGPSDFERLFAADRPLPEECLREIGSRNFRHTVLEGDVREANLLTAVQALDESLERAGPHRRRRWESGWAENLQEFIDSGYDLKKLIPKFVKRDRAIRLDGRYVLPEDPDFETSFVTVLRLWLFGRWLDDVSNIYEFGCGTAHNLVAAAQLFPDKRLYGLDWASASLEIIKVLADRLGVAVEGAAFDMHSPDYTVAVKPASGVLTSGALEQLGTDFGPFLDYLLAQKPDVCIHIETLYELYDQDCLFDYVAAKYLERRGYLRGFLPRLRELERNGLVEVLRVQRTFGSFFHDGYSFVVWRPVGRERV